MSEFLKSYLKQIAETTMRGDAREEGYYSFLKILIEDLSPTQKAAVTVLPKKTDAGNPDFRVWDGKQHITGYIEAKVPGTKLDKVEDSEQLRRYLSVFPNLILTDFYEFRLYRDGHLILKTSISEPFIPFQKKQIPLLENEEIFIELISKFFSFTFPRVFTAESLAIELAKRTRFLRDEVIAEELREENGGEGEIGAFYRAFQKYLLPDLVEDSFANLYSQTLTYGLFAARTRANEDFNRATAFKYIPATIGILRDIFRYISLDDLPVQMEVIVDDIADVLAVADLKSILHQLEKSGKGKEPIVHFYETFLDAYDPKLREEQGVYYTPEPVVSYIVRSLHELLKTRFKLNDGLAAPGVTLLDPAAGTLTFPAKAIRVAVEEYTQKYGWGGKNGFIKNQLLRNYYAFENMMAPYVIGHLNISFLFEELGYPITDNDRFRLYLTNTLNMEDIYLSDVPGLSSLNKESQEANKVKQKNILVILGNPPYTGKSTTKNDWTEKLLKTDLDGAQSYYFVDGKPLGERNPKWLQADYVKFLRFAQWKVQRVGEGVIGMITNNSYLDNPTFRGMRQSLMKTFNEIFVINLHGANINGEKTPEGEKDENVFNITLGVSIVFFVKRKDLNGCRVHQTDLYGTRKSKFNWLDANNLITTSFNETFPKTPQYKFAKPDIHNLSAYQKWLSIDQIFPKYSSAIVTSRDKLVIDIDKNNLKNRMSQLLDVSTSDDVVKGIYSIAENEHWTLEKAKKKIKRPIDIDTNITKIHYHPFDIRSIFYNDAFIERSRRELMHHMIQGENLGLITVRRVPSNMDPSYFFISDCIISNGVIRSDSKSIDFLFPLYLYSTDPQENAFQSARSPNLKPSLVEQLTLAYGYCPEPEGILAYLYGVFYSNIYRQKYAEALHDDFPRLPFTSNSGAFNNLASLGQRLIDLHLLKSDELNPPIARYQGSGEDDIIRKIEYDISKERILINKYKYFEGVSEEAWQYQIGSFKVLRNYLEERIGRLMDEPVQYIRIITALAKTIEIQKEIDLVYPEIEKSVIAF